MVGLLRANPALLSAFGTRERKYARFAFTDTLCGRESEVQVTGQKLGLSLLTNPSWIHPQSSSVRSG